MTFFKNMPRTLGAIVTCMACLAASTGFAQESTIRKNLMERLPAFSKIDEVSKTPMNGLYEVRVNDAEIFYTDAEGNFLLQGSLIDTRAKRNLTEERVEKLSAIDFRALPIKDAFVIVRGNGKRKMAVFEDPNCGYCKRFERDMQRISDVTVYMFLFPILSADSIDKAKSIWCAKDKGKVWQDLMVRDMPVPKASCDTAALDRNLEFGKRYRITGTPTLFFADGSRVPGAIGAPQIEKFLTESKTDIK
jgi:thiol:disulfide interchange protein DsbC